MNKIRLYDLYARTLKEINETPKLDFEFAKFETFINKYNKLLEINNCKLVISHANLKKQGHIKYTYNKLNRNNVKIEMKLVIQELLIENIYIFIHELTHLVNNHPFDKQLTTKQKEVVADTVAKSIVSSLFDIKDLYKGNLAKKLRLKAYSINWMQKGTLSKEKEKIMFQQIKETKELFLQELMQR